MNRFIKIDLLIVGVLLRDRKRLAALNGQLSQIYHRASEHSSRLPKAFRTGDDSRKISDFRMNHSVFQKFVLCGVGDHEAQNRGLFTASRHRQVSQDLVDDLLGADLFRLGFIGEQDPVTEHVIGEILHILGNHVAATAEEGSGPRG